MEELNDPIEGDIPCAIFKLPTEMIQHIAYFLPTDRDIINFALTCFTLAEIIIPAESTVWGNCFRDLYDTPEKLSSAALKFEYQTRSIVLRKQIKFNNGEQEKHALWLKVVLNMLFESIHLPLRNKQSTSKTFEYLRGVLYGSEFLNRPVSGYGEEEPSPPSDLFCAVQLCLTDLVLDPDMSIRCRRTDYDIGKVYSYQTNITEPLVDITKVDLESILHIRNFWLRHLMNPDEATFYNCFTSLPEWHRPKGRRGFPGKGLEISEHWLGFDSCIHPYPEKPDSFEEHQSCADLDGHLTQVEPISLQIRSHSDPANWAPLFSSTIQTMGKDEDRTYFRGIKTTHGINDDSKCLVRGFIERIPKPQGEFPGWKRIGFAIYEPNRENLKLFEASTGDEAGDEAPLFPEEHWPPIFLETDFNSIYGYEGVMLPGERIIMGRFANMLETSDRGPFIFWDL